MAARRYEISLRMLQNISRVSAANEWNIILIALFLLKEEGLQFLHQGEMSDNWYSILRLILSFRW